MKGLYKEYFQKSKVFLYPLLGIKKGVRFVPVQTYISWGDSYTEYRNRLICLYTLDKDNIDEFEIFSDVYLESSDHFVAKNRIDMYNFIYVFDLKEFKTDYTKFLKGKYSKFRKKTKDKIMKFFGEHSSTSEYIESYLFPEYYWEDYAEFLAIRETDLQKVGELCSKPDLDKENFAEDLEILKKELNL